MNLQEVGSGFDYIYLVLVVVSCECGNETSGSIKYRELLDQLSTC
jgi:hypothetical protein